MRVNTQYMLSGSRANAITSGLGNKKRYITIHETANTSKGANANAHARLQYNGNSRNASWHYTVDDKEIYQSFSRNYRCWHTGTAKGNNESIGIEICVNSDGNFDQAVRNTIKLVARIMKEENIPMSNLVQHNYWSGKNCPAFIRSGKHGWTWNQFTAAVEAELKGTESNILYRVITGSYTEKANAEARVNELKQAGYSSFIATYEEPGRTYYRVVTGSFKERANAEARMNELKSKGFNSFLLAHKS